MGPSLGQDVKIPWKDRNKTPAGELACVHGTPWLEPCKDCDTETYGQRVDN